MDGKEASLKEINKEKHSIRAYLRLYSDFKWFRSDSYYIRKSISEIRVIYSGWESGNVTNIFKDS